jgi:hypothetical protein
MPALILLLLASFVSDAEDLVAVQGELRVYLPRSIATASVDITLVEQTSQKKQIISNQFCTLFSGDSCAILLQYNIKNIDPNRHYNVDISVMSQSDKMGQAFQSSFPVLTFNNPKKLNMVISIPPEPVE